ncbi:MAG: 2-oxoacid:ferredoxin oxidoreductase subunit beta [Desulfatibacillaceae bacterium]
MVQVDDFHNDFEIKWCPGCGNFKILEAMKKAFANQGLEPRDVFLVSGIGQAAKTPHFLKCNYFHTLHGRALPVATGAKIANHELNIVVNTGDGDCYGEGGNHFMHAIRRNIDLTVLAHDNKVYGLTKGQASPTSDKGMVTKVQRHGVVDEPFSPLMVALALNASFVARAFTGWTDHLAGLIEQAMSHKGFALIDIMQPCPSFNKVNTHGWYDKRVYDLAETSHSVSDHEQAMRFAQEWGDRIPVGVFYKKEKLTATDHITALESGPLVDRQYDPQIVRSLINGLLR